MRPLGRLEEDREEYLCHRLHRQVCTHLRANPGLCQQEDHIVGHRASSGIATRNEWTANPARGRDGRGRSSVGRGRHGI